MSSTNLTQKRIAYQLTRNDGQYPGSSTVQITPKTFYNSGEAEQCLQEEMVRFGDPKRFDVLWSRSTGQLSVYVRGFHKDRCTKGAIQRYEGGWAVETVEI